MKAQCFSFFVAPHIDPEYYYEWQMRYVWCCERSADCAGISMDRCNAMRGAQPASNETALKVMIKVDHRDHKILRLWNPRPCDFLLSWVWHRSCQVTLLISAELDKLQFAHLSIGLCCHVQPSMVYSCFAAGGLITSDSGPRAAKRRQKGSHSALVSLVSHGTELAVLTTWICLCFGPNNKDEFRAWLVARRNSVFKKGLKRCAPLDADDPRPGNAAPYLGKLCHPPPTHDRAAHNAVHTQASVAWSANESQGRKRRLFQVRSFYGMPR